MPAIVGLGAACELCRHEIQQDAQRLAALRDTLENTLLTRLAGIAFSNSRSANRLPHVANLRFRGVVSESLMVALDDVAVSNGAACTSNKIEPSHVLEAMGLDSDDVNSSIRFSVGRFTSHEEIKYAGERVVECVNAIRELQSW